MEIIDSRCKVGVRLVESGGVEEIILLNGAIGHPCEHCSGGFA